MLPIRDDNPHFLTPLVTGALIFVNALVWVWYQGMGNEEVLARSICNFGLIPGGLLHTIPPRTHVSLGLGLRCVIPAHGSWITPLTSMFLHGGWIHILGNMWFLWIFGNNVEDSMGHLRFLVFYLLGGLAAAAVQIAADRTSAVPMVGASGAIGGVMGAYVMLYPRVRVHVLLFLGFFVTTIAVPAVVILGYWFLLQLLSGFAAPTSSAGGVAFWAHVGGFLFGVFSVTLFRVRELAARHPAYGWRARRSGRGSLRYRRLDS
jgi:membrane associated rhomboid family serine protease